MSSKAAPPPQLRDVLEADPVKLEQIALLHPPASAPEAAYAHVRRAYMANDRTGLARLVEDLSSRGPLFLPVHGLAALRSAIRGDRPVASHVEAVQALTSDAGVAPLWRAEALHLVAVVDELQGRDENARKGYLAAYQHFSDHGSSLRAAISYHNAVAAASRIDPTQRLFIEYDRAYQLAVAAGDQATAGVALNNLAREFQLLGALRAALKRSKQAVALLAATHFGSYQYLLALANRCDIQLDLGLCNAAAEDYEELCCTRLPEALGAAKVLHQRAVKAGLAWRPPPAGASVIIPTWAERAPAARLPALVAMAAVFTSLESTVLDVLAEGPQTTRALIERLYGETGDFLAKENRLKQLLHRIKKKAPQLIVRVDGTYTLG